MTGNRTRHCARRNEAVEQLERRELSEQDKVEREQVDLLKLTSSDESTTSENCSIIAKRHLVTATCTLQKS